MLRKRRFLMFVNSLTTPAQSFPKMMTFPSGRRVKILSVIEIETKAANGRLFRNLSMEYETHLALTDAVALQREIVEISAWLKRDAEHRQLTDASITVDEEPKSNTHTSTEAVTFFLHRKTDGSWTSSRKGFDQ